MDVCTWLSYSFAHLLEGEKRRYRGNIPQRTSVGNQLMGIVHTKHNSSCTAYNRFVQHS
jgi:hypothetical protein